MNYYNLNLKVFKLNNILVDVLNVRKDALRCKQARKHFLRGCINIALNGSVTAIDTINGFEKTISTVAERYSTPTVSSSLHYR